MLHQSEGQISVQSYLTHFVFQPYESLISLSTLDNWNILVLWVKVYLVDVLISFTAQCFDSGLKRLNAQTKYIMQFILCVVTQMFKSHFTGKNEKIYERLYSQCFSNNLGSSVESAKEKLPKAKRRI